jgi:predicted ATP-dependent serine protease
MWLVVSCIFCGALSPHSAGACLQCREAFQGAHERKMARAQAIAHQQNMQVVAAVAPVATYAAAEIGGSLMLGLLGAALDD